MGFKIADAFVEIKAKADGLREEVRAEVEKAGVGQTIKVKLGIDKAPDMGGLMSNLAPFILPAVGAIGQLSGALGLVPAAAGAAGLAYGTLKVGFSGFADALKQANTPAQIKAQQKALADLSPEARSTALAIRGLSPAWDNLRLDVQSRLFQGVSKDVQRLGIVDLPVLRRGLDDTAGSLNQGVHYFTSWATSSKTVADFRTIMENSSVSTQNLMRALQPVLGILRDVATVGSQFLPKLTSGFATAAQKAGDFVSNARDTGKLHQWIQTGIDAVKKLWDSFKDIIDIVKKLAENQGPVNLLDIINLITGSVRWLVDNMPGVIPIIESILVLYKAWKLAQLAINAVTEANPWMLVVMAIAAAAVAIYTHWAQVKDFLAATWKWISDTSSAVFTSVRDFLSGIWNAVSNKFTSTWNGIRDNATSIWNNISNFLTGALNGFRGFWSGAWNGIVGDFQGIWGRITGIASGVWNMVTGAFHIGVNSVISLINGLVDDVDKVLGFLHIALLPRVPLLAGGGVVGLAGGGTVGSGFATNGPMAIVGEGRPQYPEYVIPTDPAHRGNALALYQALGAKLMASGGIIDWIGSTVSKVEKWAGDGATGLMNSAISGLAAAIPQPFHDMATGLGSQIVAAIKALIDGTQGMFSAAFHGSPNLAAWIQQALALTGTPQSWAGPLSVLIGRESGGNPNAINNWDSNAAAGHPSQGLMQTIPGTFQAYHQAGTSWNILDPVANIAAGINYIKARYGSIFNVQQANPNLPPKGYDLGGIATGAGFLPKYTNQPERVLSPQQTASFDRLVDVLSGKGKGLGGVTINVIQQSGSPQETGRAVALALRMVG